MLLSRHPDIQRRVRNELVFVLIQNGIDYKSDPMNVLYDINLLLQLPLFRACIREILTVSQVAWTCVAYSIQRDILITTNNGKNT